MSRHSSVQYEAIDLRSPTPSSSPSSTSSTSPTPLGYIDDPTDQHGRTRPRSRSRSRQSVHASRSTPYPTSRRPSEGSTRSARSTRSAEDVGHPEQAQHEGHSESSRARTGPRGIGHTASNLGGPSTEEIPLRAGDTGPLSSARGRSSRSVGARLGMSGRKNRRSGGTERAGTTRAGIAAMPGLSEREGNSRTTGLVEWSRLGGMHEAIDLTGEDSEDEMVVTGQNIVTRAEPRTTGGRNERDGRGVAEGEEFARHMAGECCYHCRCMR